MADVRKELNFCKKTGIPVLGVVENMTETTVQLADAMESEKTGVRFVGKDGKDITAETVLKLQQHCPEILECGITSHLFMPNTPASAESNPQSMARKYGVPYLGRLPMDSNMMSCCETGDNFLEKFPDSAAAEPLRDIVKNLLQNLGEGQEEKE